MAIETIGRQYRFRVYYTDSDGYRKQYNSKKYDDKKLCKDKEAQFILAHNNPDKVNFHIVALNYFEELRTIKKESTVYTYINAYNVNIYPYFKDLDINNINVPKIKKWAEKLKKRGLAVNYLNKMYNILKNIFDYAIKNYNLKENPVTIVGRFQSPKEEVITEQEKLNYITFEEFNKFISVIDNIFWKTFFIFLYYTGCRKGEVQALSWNDIDFINNEITINKTLSLKTSKIYKITSTKNYVNRKIKMSKILKQQLLDHLKEQKECEDFSKDWFVFGGYRFLPTTTISRYKKKYFELSGVKEIKIHDFRHSHVSLLINEYIKSGQTDTTKFFLMMSNRMGHTIQVMQKTYMHLFPTVQNEIIDLLDNL